MARSLGKGRSINLGCVLGMLLLIGQALGVNDELADADHELLQGNRALQSTRVLSKTFNIPSETSTSAVGITCTQGVPSFSALQLPAYTTQSSYSGTAGTSSSPERTFPICSTAVNPKKYAEAIVPFTPSVAGWYRIAVTPTGTSDFDFAVSVGHCSSSAVPGLQDSGYYSIAGDYVQACTDGNVAGLSTYLTIPMFDRAKYYLLIDTVYSENAPANFDLSITFDRLEAVTDAQTIFDFRVGGTLTSNFALIAALSLGLPFLFLFACGMAACLGFITCERLLRRKHDVGGVVLGTAYNTAGTVNRIASPDVLAVAQVVDSKGSAIPVAQLA
jgi:hypothetical protein